MTIDIARARALTITLTLLLLAACGDTPKDDPAAPAPAATPAAAPAAEQAPQAVAEPDELKVVLLAESGVTHVVVEEAYITASAAANELDSPALWQAPDGSTWLYATSKNKDMLLIYDGDSGAFKGIAGGTGAGQGEFRRPNGIYAIDNLLLIVERDNRRVQVLSLPSLLPLGTFGDDVLKQPYGIWARSHEGGYDVIVSDSFMSTENDKRPPPLAELGERFHRFQLQVLEGALSAEPKGTFGATDAAGAIRIAESVFGDALHNRLLLAEEDQASGTRIKVYDLAGSYTGTDLGAELFKAQAEGIARWDCADGSGYWIAADQYQDRSLFHVFDRQTLTHRGSFAGKTTANTDGVWLQQAPTRAFPDGVFYAIHDDQAVAAFDWRAIATAVGVRASCSE